jgi:serine/threonine protein kinase/tetratricopeptide (TPR) repeat protein
MNTGGTCKECGTAIPAGSPDGCCPQCLFGLGLNQMQSAEGKVQNEESGGQSIERRTHSAVTVGLTEKAGDRIGRYRLLEEIGHGGCGVVYMAEQEQPVRRKVALKVIKLGMDTRQVVARFEAERQALALMDHPNIAKVLDAGATETGRPYFVMELVGGIRITDYCDQNHLSTQQRLDLFIQVCRAIQHAHQKGIIHRDIKPSNVLVTNQDGVPVPKVIDFGIAKATQGRLADDTVFTAFEQFLGTPAYMSPEQAQLGGLDVDTRSDIYSLGVLLYELLTGKTPFDSKELLAAGLEAMRRTILEKEPPTPSTRLKQAFVGDDVTLKSPPADEPATEQEVIPTGRERRLLQRKELIHQLRGDLDWIMMKCLEKDRARRYETANALATDIGRHLNNEPVAAGPPGNVYRFQKLVRRNKLTFAAGSAIVAALVAGLAVSTWALAKQGQARRDADAQRGQAQAEAAKSQQVALFLKDTFAAVGPSKALGRDATMLREILDKTSERVGRELTNQPEVESELCATLGTVYSELGDLTNAAAMHQRALDIRRRLNGDQHTNVASSLNDLGTVLQVQGRLDEAEVLHRKALVIRRGLLGPSHPDAAQSLRELGRDLFMHGELIRSNRQARYAEGESALREALAIQRKALGNESIEVASTLSSLAWALRLRNKSPEAEVLGRESLDMYQRLYGKDHPALAGVWDALGLALEKQGKLAEAETAYRQAMAARQKFLGGEHPGLRWSFVYLGRLFWNQWRLPEAEEMFRKLAARPEQQLAYTDYVVTGISSVAQLLVAQGKPGEAAAVWRDALERGQVRQPDAMNDFAWFFATPPDPEVVDAPQAISYAEQAVAATSRTNPTYLDTLAASYAAAGQFTNAVAIEREAISILRHTDYLSQYSKGAGIKRDQESKEDYALRLRLYERGVPFCHDQMLSWRCSYFLREGRLAEAETALRKCLAVREKQIPDDWRIFSTKSMLGGALLGQEKYAEAEPLLISGYEGMKGREATIPEAGKVRLKEALEGIVQFYEATGQFDQVEKWKRKLGEPDKMSEKRTP